MNNQTENEKQLDEDLQCIGSLIKELENLTTDVNYDMYKLIDTVCEIFKKTSDGLVTYKLHEPFKNYGSVSVVSKGRSLRLKYPDLFAFAADKASNVEIYPLTDETIKLTLTFSGLMKLPADKDGE